MLKDSSLTVPQTIFLFVMFLRICKGEIMFSINLSSDLHTAAEMSVQMDIMNNLGRSSIITLTKYFHSQEPKLVFFISLDKYCN